MRLRRKRAAPEHPPRTLHVDVSPELYAKRADFEHNPVTVAMTEPAADGTIEMVFTTIEPVRELRQQLTGARRNLADRNAQLASERAAHDRTKTSLRAYVEDTEGVKQEVTTLDNALGFALGALLTLDEEAPRLKGAQFQEGLRAIGRSLKPHAPRLLPSVPLGNLIETAQIRKWTRQEQAEREKIAALPPAERLALKAAAEASDPAPEADL